MEITKGNLDVALKLLEGVVPTAAFISFDEEMTGIETIVKARKLFLLDTPEERYSKMREVAMTYNMIQFGLCVFHTDETRDHFICRPFNFYLFPAADPDARGPILTMECSAIEFNRKNGMDWSKWIDNGVSYVDRVAEEGARKKYDEGNMWRQKTLNPSQREEDPSANSSKPPPENKLSGTDSNRKARKPIILQEEDSKMVNQAMEAVQAWVNRVVSTCEVANLEESASSKSKHRSRGGMGYSTSSENNANAKWEHIGPTCNSFLRAAIVERVKALPPLPQKTGRSIFIEIRPTADRWASTICLHAFTENERSAQEAKLMQVRESQYNARLGFRRVFKLLKKCKVPLVGHNCLYDLLFVMNAVEQSLPETFDEFRNQVRECFPVIFDTKLIFTSPAYTSLPCAISTADGSSHLAGLYEVFSESLSLFRNSASESSSTRRSHRLNLPAKSTVEEEFSLTLRSKEKTKEYCGPREIKFAAGFDYYSVDTKRFHDAGFDAYCTGVAFAHMSCALEAHAAIDYKRALGKIHALAELENKVYVMASLCHFSLVPHDPDSANISAFSNDSLIISGFPKDIVTGDFVSYFAPNRIATKWVNDNYIIIIPTSSDVGAVRKKGMQHTSWKVQLLNDFRANAKTSSGDRHLGGAKRKVDDDSNQPFSWEEWKKRRLILRAVDMGIGAILAATATATVALLKGN